MFDINLLITNLVKSPIGTVPKKSLQEIKDFSEKTDLDSVQRLAFEKLLRSLADHRASVVEVMSALELVSYQRMILREPIDQKLVRALIRKLQTERVIVGDRERALAIKSAQEKQAADLELFRFVGLVIILEYNVSLFLTYKSAGLDARKRLYSDEVIDTIGFTAPGIRAGVENEKTLASFILKILDEDTRNDLMRSYAEFTQRIFTAKPGEDSVAVGLAGFILDLIPHFYARGITELSDLFPESYGLHSLKEVEDICRAYSMIRRI